MSSGFAGFSAVAIGAADQEGEVLRALIEVALQELRKALAGEGFSAFIEHQGEGLGSQCAGEKLCFFSLALACGLALGFGEVSDRQLGNAGLAAQAFKAGLVVVRRGFFQAPPSISRCPEPGAAWPIRRGALAANVPTRAFPDCRSCALPGGRDGRQHQRHRPAPSRTGPCLQPGYGGGPPP